MKNLGGSVIILIIMVIFSGCASGPKPNYAAIDAAHGIAFHLDADFPAEKLCYILEKDHAG
jgi:hypothetical protein